MKNIIIKLTFLFCILGSFQLLQGQIDYYHSDIYSYIENHKSVAVLPMEVTFIDRKLSRNNEQEQEEIAQKERDLQTKFQQVFYKRLIWMKSKSKLKQMHVQDIERTNQLLKEGGIENMEDLMSYKYDDIALILGVDALIGGEVEIIQKRSLAGSLALSMIGNTNNSTDDSMLVIKIISGADGKLIWKNKRSMSNDTYWKTEKLIEKQVNGRLNKSFPYHINF